jgi:hypothetical protein
MVAAAFTLESVVAVGDFEWEELERWGLGMNSEVLEA